MPRTAIIVGAGPAGLTAAHELLERTDIVPIILEKSPIIGGISRTMNYKGNRMDMGPHRFFSKSDRVMNWWLNIMPLDDSISAGTRVSYQHKSRVIEDPCQYKEMGTPGDKKMLVIPRLTRIYFLRKFFAYPIQLSLETLRALGLKRTLVILLSFVKSRLLPRKPEKSLEDFLINRFGKRLYLLFFKDYTEKVWGRPCHEISAAWGAQRIKGLSLSKAILSAARSLAKKRSSDVSQKGTETSLIEQFLYPKYGPGSLWEEVAAQIERKGGKILLNRAVDSIYAVAGKLCSIHATNALTGELELYEGDYFFSSMPVQELIAGLQAPVPENIREIARGLQYRDFINVGVLLKRLSAEAPDTGERLSLDLKDNWIYIQERDVKVGRLMIYNNWGGGMVKDPGTTWIGMEYFCNKSEEFWSMSDDDIKNLAIDELLRMNMAAVEDVLDITVERMEKTYPAYFGTYDQFPLLQEYISGFANLFLVGRNGMHKYNNADHSMLTAMVSVDNIVAGITSKENIWAINTEQEYHEEKQPVHVHEEALRQDPVGIGDVIWGNKWNRAYLLLGFGVFLLQFILFKFRYPFANYMPDSYSYLEAAYSNADVNMWPVAYSKFLRQISVFTHSDKLLVALQYFFLQASLLLFLFTITSLFTFKKGPKTFLYVFFLVNPAPLYIANYVSADSLFISFSLLWLSTLIWIVFRPKNWMIAVHALLLLCCFTLRYNAIYYPMLSIAAFFFTARSWRWKLSGISLGCLAVLFSYLVTTQKMVEATGKKEFSGFGGWQLANNALYMYQDMPASRRHAVPKRFGKLDSMVRQHFDTLSKVKLTAADSANSYWYLWSHRGPLYQYMFAEYKKDSTTPFFKRWAGEAPLYLDYARWLIQSYPVEYAQHFVLPNLVKFAIPPAEFLGIYNMGSDSVGTIAKTWFNYASQKVKPSAPKDKNSPPTSIMDRFTTFAGMVNIFLGCCLIAALAMRLWSRGDRRLNRIIWLLVAFWMVNMGFSIVASPIVMRYQFFPVIVAMSLALLLGENIYQYAIQKDEADEKLSIPPA